MRHGSASDPAAWFTLAKDDLEKAKIAIGAARPEWALEQIQQAAEKAMKGWLIEKGWPLRKLHDLSDLSDETLKHGLDLSWFKQTADLLGVEYLAGRYPGFEEPMPDLADAEQAFAATEKLLAQLIPKKP